MTDTIMPYRYFNSFIPHLARLQLGANIFYDQKANLNYDKVAALKRAGVSIIQPGIETLSSSYSRLMKKGVTTRQNVDLLRFCRYLDVSVNYNLLYGFPNDKREYLEATLQLVKCIAHLHPPSGLYPLSRDRFSPYFERLSEHGITNLTPIDGYYNAC
jgi:radical SAM superfamily enzyme YgiQ (UPF0313 family)